MEANHDTDEKSPPPSPEMFKDVLDEYYMVCMAEAYKLTKSTYINSVCRRCGMVVQNKKPGDMV